MASTRVIYTAHGSNREAFTPGDWGLFAYLSLMGGSTFFFISIGLDAFHPGLVTWVRLGLGALVLTAFPRVRRIRLAREDRVRVSLLGLLWMAIPMTLFPLAQQWIDSAVAGMLNGATPIFTGVVATLLLRTLPGRLQIAGLLIGFAGIVSIALPSAGSGTNAAAGVVLVLTATICYSVALNVITPLQQAYGALPVIARVQWVALTLATPFGAYGVTRSSFAWSSLLAILTLGVFGTGLAFAVMATLAGRVGSTRAAFFTYAMPVVALILGVTFRDELVTPVAIVGVAFVITGAVLASRPEVRPQPTDR